MTPSSRDPQLTHIYEDSFPSSHSQLQKFDRRVPFRAPHSTPLQGGIEAQLYSGLSGRLHYSIAQPVSFQSRTCLVGGVSGCGWRGQRGVFCALPGLSAEGWRPPLQKGLSGPQHLGQHQEARQPVWGYLLSKQLPRQRVTTLPFSPTRPAGSNGDHL